MSDLVGGVIDGRYQVEAFLGKGSMAEVYKVWDAERRVHLALKVLHADLAEDRVFLRRFQREAQTLTRLQHPNIVRCYGLEQSGNLVYILMDYVEGKTLRKEIFEANGPLPWRRIQQVMKPLCAALYYAHKLGFAHCDIKPANIMVHGGGNILVADFGIARLTESATTTLLGAGTPAYMAPEQILGENPTPQTDIYAIGVILFEMLTGGERPFTGESAKTSGSLSEKVRWEKLSLPAPPPSKYNPAVSPELDGITLKCLDKSPANRYLSAVDLYASLAALGENAVRSSGTIRPAGYRQPSQAAKAGKKRTRIVIASLLAGFSALMVAMVCLFAGFQIFGRFLRTPTPVSNMPLPEGGFTATFAPMPSVEPAATMTSTPEPTLTFTPTLEPTLTPTFTPTFTFTPRPPTSIPATPTKKPKENDGGGGSGGGGPIPGGG